MVNTEVRVVNKQGEDVTPNGAELGEIIVKGNGITEANQTLVDGWLYTGDIGTIDDQGNIHVVKHKNAQITDNVENIASLEVEGVLYKHPEVEEVAVIVTPHIEWGETSHAFIVPREGSAVTEDDLIEFSKEKLLHYKCPKAITFMDELPKTASGKILRVKLQEM